MTERSDTATRGATNSRRAVLGGLAGALAAGAAIPANAQGGGQQRDYGRGAAPVRYPDADIVTLDKKRFTAPLGNIAIRRLYTGLGWAEGPAWHATGRFWIWSDIPNDECLRMNEEDHSVHRRLPQPLGLLQRQYLRPRGTADRLPPLQPRRGALRAGREA